MLFEFDLNISIYLAVIFSPANDTLWVDTLYYRPGVVWLKGIPWPTKVFNHHYRDIYWLHKDVTDMPWLPDKADSHPIDANHALNPP